MTQERFLLVPPGCARDTVMRDMAHNPERSSGDIFRELQRRSPGRYQPLQIRTLQRGMRKIRAYLLETLEDERPAEVIHGPSPSPVSAEVHQHILTIAN
jgi:hypothetical protein